VCSLFNGEVKIVAEGDLKGKVVKANGRFDFMLRRGSKAVCVVEAKRYDMGQGMAQDLVGCEVAAEVVGLNVVYGIVTNFVQWIFLRRSDDKVEKDACVLLPIPDDPELHSLRNIAEKIYGMLY
jgi:predicted type IV restriction endonuclease